MNAAGAIAMAEAIDPGTPVGIGMDDEGGGTLHDDRRNVLWLESARHLGRSHDLGQPDRNERSGLGAARHMGQPGDLGQPRHLGQQYRSGTATS